MPSKDTYAADIEARRRQALLRKRRRQLIVEKWLRLGRPDIVERKLVIFEQQDMQHEIDKRTFEYVCTSCNRPFTRARRIRTILCGECAKFFKLKRSREYDKRHREKVASNQTVPKKRPEPALKPVPTPVNQEPTVVWSASDRS